MIFSGGQDSTTCLFQVIAEFGKENVEVVTFQYGQRHAIELEKGLNEYLIVSKQLVFKLDFLVGC